MPVYDDEKKLNDKQLREKEASKHNDLVASSDDREAETDELEKLYKDSPDNESTDGDNSESHEFIYTPGSRQKRSSGFVGKHKKLLLMGGGGGLFLLAGVVGIMVFLGSLGIQNLATHVAEYNLLRSVRTFRQTTNGIVSERFTADVTAEKTDGLLARTKAKYGDFRSSTWGKLDRFRPQQIIDNLNGQGKIQYVYQEVDRRIVPGKRLDLKAVIVDGQRIDLPETSRLNFFGNTIERLRFGQTVDNALAAAVPEAPNIVRSRVTKDLMSKLGFTYRWWPKNGVEYKGLSQEEAFAKLQSESSDAIREKPSGGSVVPDVSEQVESSEDEFGREIAEETAEELSLAEAREADILAAEAAREGVTQLDDIADDAVRSTFSQTLRGAFQDSLAESALRTASTAYQIALPVCMIYDGSIVRAGPSIDAKSESLMRTELSLQTAADQQKAGKTTAEAVGAMRNKLGNIGPTLPEARARGETIDTRSLASGPDNPQSGVFGDYTILDVFGQESILTEFLNQSLESICPKVLDTKVVAAAVAAELVLAYFSAGSSEGAAKAASEAMGVATREIVTEAIEKTLVQKIRTGAFGVLKRAGRDLLTFGSLTIGAKLLTVQYANAQHNGLSTSGDFAMEADMGGNIRNSETLRRGMYGRPMKVEEVQQSKLADASFRKAELQQQSPFERYIALNNPDSLIAKTGYAAMAKMPSLHGTSNWLSSNLLGNVAKLLSGEGFSYLAHLFSGKAQAAYGAENFVGDYNIIQWGWTEDELELIRNNPEYSPLVNAEEVASRSEFYDAIEEKYDHCFTDSIGTLIEERDVKRSKEGNVTDEGECSPKELGLGNTGSVAGQTIGDGVFRWRLSKLNEKTLDHLLGVQDPGPEGGVNSTLAGEGVTCPSLLEAHPSQPGYYKMPEAPNGEYLLQSPDAQRYGSKQLVCVLYTVAMNYAKLYPGKSKLQIFDLNASGHQSHYRGIAVDLNAGGEIAAADHLTPTGTYSTEATIALGKLFANTKSVSSILWCEPGSSNGSASGTDGSMTAIRNYAASIGKSISVKCIAPNGLSGDATHANHFHVSIDLDYALPGRFTP